MHKTRTRPQGFTLMELFITVFVLLSIFATFVTMHYALKNFAKKSNQAVLANDQAFAKLQAYQQVSSFPLPSGDDKWPKYQVEDFTSDLPASMGSTRTGVVYVLPVGDNPRLRKVDVVITYQDGREERTVHHAAIRSSEPEK